MDILRYSGIPLWQRKTTLERGLFILVILLAICLCIIAPILAFRESQVRALKKQTEETVKCGEEPLVPEVNKKTNVTLEETVKCGEAPVVPEARKQTSGYLPGHVATYTCNPDYTPCHNRTTSVCQYTGKWGHMQALCGQFRWHNPSSKRGFNLPCGSAERFKITIRGTPMKSGSVAFDIQRGGDLLMHSSFRFGANKGYFNTRMSGSWGRRVSVTTTPLVVGQPFNVGIQLYNGTYIVKVDGALLPSFQDRSSGMKPDEVAVFRDVSLQLVEYTV